jgi:hypothetical protein
LEEKEMKMVGGEWDEDGWRKMDENGWRKMG